jgi:hypothetical protein
MSEMPDEQAPEYLLSNIDEWLPESLPATGTSRQIFWLARTVENFGRLLHATTDEQPRILTECRWTDGSDLTIPEPIREAAEALFSIGGRYAYFFADDVHLTEYTLEHAIEVCHHTPISLKEMAPVGSERNALKIWTEDPDRYIIMSGWGLTYEDDYWRPHTWVLDTSTSALIETNVRRDRYFGAGVNGEAWRLRCGGEDEHQ